MREKRGKTNVVGLVQKGSKRRWYFTRLGFLAVPKGGARGNRRNQRGTLFTQYYLLEAASIKSAFKKADLILSICENRDRGARLKGRPVDFMKIGIFDLEPLYQKLTDGVELFDESELKVTYGRAKRRVMVSR